MNRIKYFAAAIILMTSAAAYGRTVTVDEARASAKSLMSTARKTKGSVAELALKHTSTDQISGNPAYYVFGNNDSFVIVAGDTELPRILGYSDCGGFPDDPSQLPPAMRTYLSLYDENVSRLYSGTDGVMAAASAAASGRKDIAPMITTQWNQGSPYNCLLPDDKDAREKPLTGCVATAAAQVIAYHKYFKGNDSHTNLRTTLPSAWCDKTTVDFSTLNFDWSKMPNKVTAYSSQAEKDEVGKLMLAVGTAFDMNWGADSSGAFTQFSAFIFHHYFGYSKATEWAFHDYYTEEDWEQLAYDQLADGCPLLFAGSSVDGGGHSFVCDGYKADTNMFHFNWGWGGSQDGWFVMADRTNYPESQGFLLNGRPPREGDKVGNHIGTRSYADATLDKWMSDEDGYDYDPPIPFQYMACGDTSWACYWMQGHTEVWPEIDVCDMDGNHIEYYHWIKVGKGTMIYATNYGYSLVCNDEKTNSWALSNSGKSKGFDVELPLRDMAGGCYRVYPCSEVSIDGGETYTERYHMKVYPGAADHSVIVVPPEAANLESRALGDCYKTYMPDQFVPLTGVEIGDDIDLGIGQTKQLSPVYSTKYASAKFVKYESSDPNVAEVSATGLVKAKTDGVATITAKACDGSGVSDSLVVTAGTGVPGSVDGVYDEALEIAANGTEITVKGAKGSIEVYTIAGTLVGASTASQASIQVTAPGVYLVRVANRCFKVKI